MDLRNREELLKKQEQLEDYLLEHPDSNLYGWYARQNMEAGELERALKICKLGLEGGKNTGLLHKLMGECYLAKGEITQAMKHFVESVLTGEPFPSVISELIKNLSDTMEAEQIAFLVRQMNSALPGHPEATRFFQKFPTARTMQVNQQQVNFLQDLAEALARKSRAEGGMREAEEDLDALIAKTKPPETAPETAPVAPTGPEPATPPVVAAPEPVTPTPPAEPVKAEPVAPPPAPEPEPQPEIAPEPVPEPEYPSEPPLDELPVPQLRPVEKPVSRQAPAAKHTITKSMATFTLMQVFKDQGMFEQALEVLDFLREKTPNQDRIDTEYKEIQRLIVENGG